jgi:RecA/RadA recombinase
MTTPTNGTDFLSVLTHASLPMAKTWQLDGSVTPYGNGKHFRPTRLPVTDIHTLSSALTPLAARSRSCVVRGKYKGDEYSAQHEPEHESGKALRRLHLFDDVPHHWFMVDVDNYQPLACDPLTDPVGAIEEFITCHLPAFRDSSYHWQLSASAGQPKNRDILKAHLWFWSETAYDSAQLKAWAQANQIETDTALFNPVQAHYTANPLFADGVVDPVPLRQGLVTKQHDAVTFTAPPAGAPSKTRAAMLVATHQSDPVAQRLFELGHVHRVGPKGELFIECPRADQHTSEGAETTTTYYPANTGGYAQGHFHCLHSHCVDEPDQTFLDRIGFSVLDDFEDLGTQPVEPTTSVAGRFEAIDWHTFAHGGTPLSWLVKGVLPAGGVSMVYGASGSGKTFVSLDMAMAIARGEPWRGLKTKQGLVVYVVAESPGGFRLRLQAYDRQYPLPHDEVLLKVIADAPQLMDKRQVRDLIKELTSYGTIALVILDTLARVAVGADENSSQDMGMALDATHQIAAACGCAVLLVHHSGKDADKGARGSSAIKATLDAELEVTRADDDRVVRVTKLKDGEEGATYGFTLLRIVLGLDEDEEEVSSCVVEHNDRSGAAVRRKKYLGQYEKMLLRAVADLAISADGFVELEDAISAAILLMPEPKNGARDRRYDGVKRALKQIEDAGLIELSGSKIRAETA